MKKLTTIRTIYLISIINIFITLFVSSLIISLRGYQQEIIVFFENDSAFLISLFLMFIILYPIIFFVLYLITFTIQILIKDGPAEI